MNLYSMIRNISATTIKIDELKNRFKKSYCRKSKLKKKHLLEQQKKNQPSLMINGMAKLIKQSVNPSLIVHPTFPEAKAGIGSSVTSTTWQT